MSAIDETLERLQESVEQIGVAAATSLRNAVEMFNASPISLSSVDAFRERVLRVADHLDSPLQERPVAGPLSEALAEVHAIGESKRVE